MFFRQSDSGHSVGHQVAVIQGTIILLSAALALATARIFNRKTLLVTSGLGTGLSLTVLGLYYYYSQFSDLTNWSWVPLLSIIVIIFTFMIGFGAIAWTVMAEILPTKVIYIMGFLNLLPTNSFHFKLKRINNIDLHNHQDPISRLNKISHYLFYTFLTSRYNVKN